MKRHAVFVFLLIGLAAGSWARTTATIVVSGATLIDGTGRSPAPNATIVIVGDRIAAVYSSKPPAFPPAARIIDAAGKYVLPGLIDTHVHLELVGLSDVGDLPPGWKTKDKLQGLILADMRLDVISGFTTVRDLGSTEAVLRIRDRINSGDLWGPRIVASGMQLVKKSPSAPPEGMFLEYDGPDDARSKVRLLAGMGVDVIKIRLTRQRPIPALDEVRAIVDEAHRSGLRTTVHTDVPADDLVRLAIDAGADGVEHNAPLRAQDPGILARMAERHMSLMAGAGHFFLQRIDTTGLIDSFDDPQRRFLPSDVLAALRAGLGHLHEQTSEMAKSGWSAAKRQEGFIQEVQRARKAGVLLVFGTDCGGYGMMHGEQYKALYGETRMGSSAMETILMATRDAAIALGKAGDLGTIEPGKLADMIIVNADPLADLRNVHQLYRVIKGGTVYDPAELANKNPS
jgi:imidazolonepropionase-like amidohydrolase